MDGGIKKWFMLQMWRIQQVAQVVTIALLAANLSLTIFDYMQWREGPFESPYSGVPIIMLLLVVLVWGVAIVWDIRMKMWREQATVLVERNPYVKEKMSSKEVALISLFNLPLVEKLAEDDPKFKPYADGLKAWLNTAMEQDANIKRDVDDIFKHIGQDSGAVMPKKK